MVIRKYFSSKYSDQKHDNDAVKKKRNMIMIHHFS